MILAPPTLPTGKYPLGTRAEFLLPVDDTSQTYWYTVHALNAAQYLDTEFKYSPTAVQIPATTYISFPNTTGDYLKVDVSTYYLTQPDFLSIHVENSTDPTDFSEFIIQAGDFVALAADTINLYGYLHDTYGRPIVREPITFTVLNSASYFDNAPITTLNATTLTDEQGRFEININRRYDYVMSISRLNYTKVLKISEVPDSVTSLEVIIGRGLVCD